MENHTIVTLKKGEGRTIKAGGAWIFDNEIDTITGKFTNGDIVVVHDFDGYPMGRGFINQNSKIRIRMMTRKADQLIDDDFIRMRVQNAWDYRKNVMYGGNDILSDEEKGRITAIGTTERFDLNCCRVIFGEADFLPGLTVDKYADVLVVECLALGMEQFKSKIVKMLLEVLAADGINIRLVYERSDAKERDKEGLKRYKGVLWSSDARLAVRIGENDYGKSVPTIGTASDIADSEKAKDFIGKGIDLSANHVIDTDHCVNYSIFSSNIEEIYLLPI